MAAEQTASMTETCPTCGAIIDTAAAEPLARVICPTCGEKVRVQRSFNNFELVETLGVGGMGTVYKARDILLDRFVALKLLRKDLPEEGDYATRLQQEARVAASVNHPNVIQVFSSGKDHGQFYLVMELVDHGSLDDLIEEKKKLPEGLVLEAGIQVAKGLRAAYAKKLIHRDVKPANILFADEHTAKIGDFGLAGVAAENSETRDEIWGTPYYVAPERLYNRPEDFRSDIYSLGATLFHAISGRAPIEGDTTSATALRELKSRPPILRVIAPDVSEATALVLQRMIAAEPVNRFGSYNDLVTALEQAYAKLTGKDVASSPGRKMPWIMAAVAILIALAVAIGAFLWTAQRSRQASRQSAAVATATVAAAPVLSAVALADLERRSSEARHQLLINHFNVAGAEFGRIAGEAQGKQPLYNWSRLQQGMAAMVGRDEGQARQAFQDVGNAGRTGFAREESGMAQFFVTTVERLLEPGVISAPGAGAKAAGNYETFAALLFGLKNVERSNAEQAIPWFEAFQKSTPGNAIAWMNELKPLAQRYEEDCRAYLEWKSQPGSDSNAAETADKLERLTALRKKLKANTSFSDDIKAQEKSLAGRVADRQKENETKLAEQRSKLLETEMPLWKAAVLNSRRHVATYDFASALAALGNVKITEPGLHDEQAGALKKAQWLVDWKTTLIADLNRTHFTGTITDLAGAKYSGIDGAHEQNVTVKIGPYGSAQVPLVKFLPKTLLGVSEALARTDPDRQWLSAVFASETGQAEEARRLGEAAAKTKPAYGEQLTLLNKPD